MVNKPIVPLGSFLARPKNERLRPRTIILLVVTFHAAVLGGVLIQGCRNQREKAESLSSLMTTNEPEASLSNSIPEVLLSRTTDSNSLPALGSTPAISEPVQESQPVLQSLAATRTLSAPSADLPPTKELAAKANRIKGKSSERPSLYTVKAGDTLGKIAKAHHTTVASLKAANGLKTDIIAVGKKLRIPSPNSKLVRR